MTFGFNIFALLIKCLLVYDSVLVRGVDYLDLKTFLVASNRKTTHLG